MESTALLVILSLTVGTALGGSLKSDYDPEQTDVIYEDEIDELDETKLLVFELLNLSEEEVAKLWTDVLESLHRGGHCQDNVCKLCLNLPFTGPVCFELEYVKSSPPTLHLAITKRDHEIFCITVANNLPKVCLFHHLCAQVVDINITKGNLCASFDFNGLTIVKDQCIHF